MLSKKGARAVLQAATHAYHDRVDRVFSCARLDDRASYGAFLQAQAAAHLPVEQALTAHGAATMIPDWAVRQRGALLLDDLAALGLDAPEPAGAIAFADESAVLGGVYVLEGSRLGGSMLKRAIPSDFPTRFLGGVDSAAWRGLLQMLDVRLDDTLKQSAAVAAACAVFELFEMSGQRHVRTGTLG